MSDAPSSAAAVDEPTPVEAPPAARLAYFGRPSLCGAALAIIFWWRSLSPTLMPRTWIAQGIVTGVCIAIGYAIGTLLGRVGHLLLQRFGLEVPESARRGARWGVVGGAFAVSVLSWTAWPDWQDAQRDLLGMDHDPRVVALPMQLVALVVASMLGLFGRWVGRGVQRLHRFNLRHLPVAVATVATIAIVGVVANFVLRDVLVARLVGWADTSFGAVDAGTNEGTVRPTSATSSGSPDSLVAWNTLGVQGREFVAHATSTERIEDFTGQPATNPIRVYAGIRSAADVEERAQLAVEELDRTDAWDRDVLVVATTTGTGWIDPDAAEALEVMHGGNTAIVGMQYSFLPSWISTLVDQGNAQEAGRALFEAVHDAWAQQPTEHRPKLIAFGLSLGSYGGEAAFAGSDLRASVESMARLTDGVLFVGPTNDNVIWRQLTSGRDLGSPYWEPVIDGGRQVRFQTRSPEAGALPADWEDPHILYVQHPSDPVTFWTMDGWRTRPGWMDSPTGHDVSNDVSWTPIVTWVQGLYDLTAGFAAPPGHGHDFRLDYARSWGRVVPPDGWTDRDTRRLEDFLFPSGD
ncbi:MAG: alpha/beta-hydrolase family protein [Acidimicrobiales bacterium]|nr:alpha/beta-hydrolase family protein [Acidimicrobiales bacterium]